ncbi:beta-lactamase/transpeptidase-like protein [Paramyrothecium foliicola]|nr:beta-lactamase/transpeptidase-like protein [Paramyrothecium foliicola]
MKVVAENLRAVGPATDKIISLSPLSGTVGAAVGVVHAGEVIHTAGYGFRDVGRQLPMDEDSIVSLFSLTKSMTAAAIETLVDAHKTSWGANLVSLRPDLH